MKKILSLLALMMLCIMGANAETVKYALNAGDTFTSGQTVEVKNGDAVVATITYGESAGTEAFKAAKANNSVEGYTAFTEGNGVNGNNEGGTFYTITPKVNATITVAVVLNANKAFYIEEDGVALEAYNGIKVEAKYYGTYEFDAKADKAYKVYCAGSKLGFYGFEMTFGSEEPATEAVYTVAGNNTAIFGTEWDAANAANDMVKGEDGIYTKIYEGVELTNNYKVEYKVVENHSWDVSYGNNGGNADYTVWEGDGKYDVTFTFNPETKAVACSMTKAEVTFNFADPNFRANIGETVTDTKGYIYNETFTANGVTLQITAGSAPSRIYVDANRGQCLVTYTQYSTLTFEAPEGKAITKIEFTAAGNSNINKYTASSGTIEGMVWTGNADGVRFTQGATSYLANAIVTLEAESQATEVLMPLEYLYCGNIAAFNALEAGTYARIKLENAEVIAKSADGYSTVWIQDATGGAWIQYTSLNDRLQEGTKINGDIYTIKRANSGNSQIKEAEDTPTSKFDAEAITEYTMVEGTIAEVNVAENLNKVVKISGATLTMTSATAGQLTQGDVTINVNNGTATANQQLHKIADWEKDKVLENVNIVAILVGNGSTNQLLPISIESVVACPYYLVGNMTNWVDEGVKEEYNLTLNTEAGEGVEEYMITLDLKTTDQFKIVKKDGENYTWYPDGTGNDYGQNGEITKDGNYTVYFRPNADGASDWFYGVIYVLNNTTDGINTVTNTNQNGTIFNLNGQKVMKAQKGLYIINGKKQVVK